MPRRRASAREDLEESDAEVGPSTQRRRISEAEVDEPYGDDEDGEDTQDNTADREQMVKNLVRLALACEYTRTPLRRTEVNARIMGTHIRQFRKVFASAQQQLREVFGMEMTELPVKEKITLQQKRAAAKSQYQKDAARSQTQRTNGKSQSASQASQQASNAWILTTILPQRLRIPGVVPPPNAPTSEAESQYTALASFIVSIIMLNAGSIHESKLERFLIRANINEVTPFNNSLVMGSLDKTDKLLKKLEKDGFIVKIKDTTGGDEVVEYVLGARGKVEIGKSGVEGMVRTVYGEVEDQTEFDLRLRKTLGRVQLIPHEEATLAT